MQTDMLVHLGSDNKLTEYASVDLEKLNERSKWMNDGPAKEYQLKLRRQIINSAFAISV